MSGALGRDPDSVPQNQCGPVAVQGEIRHGDVAIATITVAGQAPSGECQSRRKMLSPRDREHDAEVSRTEWDRAVSM